MSMTDPIADLLTRIRNGARARHEQVSMPWSGIKEQVARVLSQEGYVRDISVSGEVAKRTLTVVLRYTDGGESVITGLQRVSRPGLRRYTSAADVPKVRDGLGVSIVSTPEGVLADRDARRRNVGGEIICEVW
jgi:small subunit ribosomal protein S8